MLTRTPFDGPAGRPVQYLEVPRVEKAGQADVTDAVEDAELEGVLDDLTGAQGGMRPEDILVITCRPETKSRWYRADGHKLGEHHLRWLR